MTVPMLNKTWTIGYHIHPLRGMGNGMRAIFEVSRILRPQGLLLLLAFLLAYPVTLLCEHFSKDNGRDCTVILAGKIGYG